MKRGDLEICCGLALAATISPSHSPSGVSGEEGGGQSVSRHTDGPCWRRGHLGRCRLGRGAIPRCRIPRQHAAHHESPVGITQPHRVRCLWAHCVCGRCAHGCFYGLCCPLEIGAAEGAPPPRTQRPRLLAAPAPPAQVVLVLPLPARARAGWRVAARARVPVWAARVAFATTSVPGTGDLQPPTPTAARN